MTAEQIRHPHRDSMDFALHQYYLLSNEHDLLRQRLAMTVPEPSSPFPPSTTSTRNGSTSTSPSASAYYDTTPLPSQPVPVFPDRSTDRAVSTTSFPTAPPRARADEARLVDINHQIKATLTELLNAPEVRHDERMRAWVQERLMDAERELKRQRRRRSSAEREAWEGARAMMA